MHLALGPLTYGAGNLSHQVTRALSVLGVTKLHVHYQCWVLCSNEPFSCFFCISLRYDA